MVCQGSFLAVAEASFGEAFTVAGMMRGCDLNIGLLLEGSIVLMVRWVARSADRHGVVE